MEERIDDMKKYGVTLISKSVLGGEEREREREKPRTNITNVCFALCLN